MTNELKNRGYTGKYYFKKRFFGGYDVMIEKQGNYISSHDGSVGPDFNYWDKATERDLNEFKLTLNE